MAGFRHRRPCAAAFPTGDSGRQQKYTGLICGTACPIPFQHTARPGHTPWPRRFLFASYTVYTLRFSKTGQIQTAYSLAVSNTSFFPKTWRVLLRQDGSCATHNPHPAKGLRLWTPARRSALRFSRSQKARKGRWKRRRVTLDMEVKKREFPKVKWQLHPMPPTGKWSKSLSRNRWMNHGWMRLLPCTCAVQGTQCRRFANELFRHTPAPRTEP